MTKNKFLIIGAGGAARSIIAGLIEDKVKNIIITNRTIKKAKNLAKEFAIEYAENISLEEQINKVDIVINTSSCGLNGKNNINIDYTKIEQQKIFYDIVYKPLITKFLADAKDNNHKIITGIGMLLHQAEPAFYYFFKKHVKVSKSLKVTIL